MSFEHEIDRARFELRRRAMEMGKRAEEDMKRQRRELGLPENPKSLTKRGNVTELKFKKE